MVAARFVVLVLAFTAMSLGVAEAKKKKVSGIAVTKKFFGMNEKWLLTHPKKIKSFHAKYKTNGIKTLTTSGKGLPTCKFDPSMGTNGLTICQDNVCKCRAHETCNKYAAPALSDMGICECSNTICTPSSGLRCMKAGKVNGVPYYQCSLPPAPTPYRRSRLMLSTES